MAANTSGRLLTKRNGRVFWKTKAIGFCASGTMRCCQTSKACVRSSLGSCGITPTLTRPHQGGGNALMNEHLMADKTILIVDDTPANIAAALAILKDQYRTKVATSGAKALEHAGAADKPDLILLDVTMPEMDGYEVCARLKADPKTAAIPVVFLTARTEAEDEAKGFELGSVDYIHKPFNPTVVRARVHTHLLLRDTLKQIEERNAALDEKTKMLESLSVKLSKYLSPQVYASIFAGSRDVELATERKRLTVFFSDIKDFVATTADMQPEDLTAMLNRYFTAMSKIALAHGAHIDKFIGDAMLMFFGDPETKGAEEDARACVRMAVAMQRQMVELQQEWRASGF